MLCFPALSMWSILGFFYRQEENLPCSQFLLWVPWVRLQPGPEQVLSHPAPLVPGMCSSCKEPFVDLEQQQNWGFSKDWNPLSRGNHELLTSFVMRTLIAQSHSKLSCSQCVFEGWRSKLSWSIHWVLQLTSPVPLLLSYNSISMWFTQAPVDLPLL